MARFNLFQFLRTSNPATAYPALQPGEVAFNLAKLQAAIGGIDGNTEIFAVRFFSAHSTYAVGDFVVNAGTLLRCITAVTVPGAFDSADWGGAAGGLSDAPSDGSAYSRQNAAWVVITPALVGAPPLNPSDGKYYIRRNAAWAEAVASSIRRGVSSTVDADMTTIEGNVGTNTSDIAALEAAMALTVPEAPNNGTTYGRRNLGWAAIAAGSGDVVGPAGGTVNGDIVGFADATGKLLRVLANIASGKVTNASAVVGTTITDALNTINAFLGTLGTAATRNIGTAAGNVPVLDGGGKLDTATLPSIAITDVFVVASQAAMLALNAQTGDIAVRTDLNKSFALATNSPGTLVDWKELLTPTDAVLSVAGLTGAIAAGALRTAMSLVVGTDVQAHGNQLDILSALANDPAVFDAVFQIDNGATPIPANTTTELRFDVPCVIVGWALTSPVSCTAVMDLWMSTWAAYPPVVGGVITASAKPTLTAALAAESTALTGWTTAIASKNVLFARVNSNNNATRLTLTLKCKRV